jgi:solute carrier family 25 aspartate/glutamate transporter 12/13
MSSSGTKKQIPFFQKLAVGGVAGVVGTSCVFPLDMVKTRLQSQMSSGPRLYNGPMQCFRMIVAKEGAGGLYRGLLPNLIGVIPEKAIKLAANDALRELFRDDQGGLSLPKEILAGAGAGFFQVIATNPMEITKIRLQMQATLPKSQRQSTMNVIRSLGLRGMYTGTPATLARDVPYSILFFPGYSNLRKCFEDENGDCGIFATLFCGGTAAAAAAGICTPMDVIKTRLQVSGASERYKGAVDCVKKVYAEEGAGAFFKGAVPRMSVSAPLFGICLLFFEMQKAYLLGSGGP